MCRDGRAAIMNPNLKTLSRFAVTCSIAVRIAAAAISAALVATTAAGAGEAFTPQQVIQAFEDTFDVHPGQRRNHPDTICARGEFVSTSAASVLSRSRLFAGYPLPVVARFSVIGGDARAERARELALEFRLPDGSLQHMAMLNTPVFVPSEPLTFNEMIKAVKPAASTGEPDQERLHDFLRLHPDAFARSNFLAAADPSPGYASSPYFSIHTFRFIDAAGRTHFVRWRFLPAEEEKRMTESQAVWPRGNSMAQRLLERLRTGPVRWDMIVYVGQPGDTTDNASIAWPESRRHFKAGTLTITQAGPESAADCEKAGFDPLIVADGIGLADDPVLLFRSPTYAIAFVGRLARALGSPPAAVVDR